MSIKLSSIIGMSITDFSTLVEKGEVLRVSKARLIPTYKPGNEKPLTSIFLSALKLVKEFKREIFSKANLIKSGKMFVFTEPYFLKFEAANKHNNPDGLIIIVKANKIIDAALLEVKNQNNNLDEKQILDYLEIAKTYKIPKLITISNEFVSTPTQSPLNIKSPNSVKLYHFSWSNIMTIANILLYDNDLNIEDPDQVEIMREVLNYLEYSASGVTGFTSMKPGWVNIIDKIRSRTLLNKNDPDVQETVSSWLQEERDMALILSRKIGSYVESGKSKYRNDLTARIHAEVKYLIENKALISVLHIPNAASDIKVSAFFEARQIALEVILIPPDNKTTRGKISWIRNQLITCEKKNPEAHNKIKNELAVYVYIKYQYEPVKFKIEELEDAWEKLKNVEIKKFGIREEKSLAKTFESRRKVVERIEEMLLDYYEGLVQYLKKWIKPAPKIIEQRSDPKNLDSIE